MQTKGTVQKGIFLVVAVLFLLSLIPVFAMAFYAYPSADDLTYGVSTARAWQENHSLSSVVSAAWEGTMEKYQTWQGSFFAVLLMHLQPAVFGTSCYSVGVLLLLIGYLTFGALLLYTISRRLFSCARLPAGIITLVLLFLSLSFTYDPVESFFWYNGGVYYTFFYSLSLLLFSLLILAATAKGKAAAAVPAILSLPLAFFIGGGNYSSALMSASLLFLLLVLSVWKRRKKEAIVLLLVFASLMASFLISILAPGNAVRQMEAGGASSPVKAILLSLVYGVYAFCNSMTLPVVVGWAFLTPFLYRAVSRLSFRFPYPLAVFLLAYGVFCTQGTPVFYALGFSMPERVIDIIYFSVYPFFLLVWAYFLGWLSHRDWWLTRWARVSSELPKGKAGLCAFFALICFCAGTVGLIRIDKDPETGAMRLQGLPLSAQAALSLVTGEAQSFHAQLTAREALYEDPTIADVRVEPLQEKPYLLFQEDITEDPAYWVNTSTAAYYGKESVALSGAAPQAE